MWQVGVEAPEVPREILVFCSPSPQVAQFPTQVCGKVGAGLEEEEAPPAGVVQGVMQAWSDSGFALL